MKNPSFPGYRPLQRLTLATALGALALQAPALAQNSVHPGFAFSSLRPAGFDPMVGGLDFLPDGRLVVATWEGFGATKGSVWIVGNAQTGDRTKVTFKKFASNLNEPLGVKVVNGEIYLLQKDKLSLLPDKDKDGLADTVKTVSSGWKVRTGAGEEKNLEFAMGMAHKGGVFYGGLATAWGLEKLQSLERGCLIEMSVQTGGFTPYACGFRTPNGVALGPDNEIFVTENQGNWVPSSKLINVRKGRFYGVHKPNPPGPFDSEPESPPAVWMPHGEISISPTQPAWLKTGVFKGQMIAGDNNYGTLQRFFLEKVGGEFQGAVFRFTAGLEAAANRIVAGPDGALYVGGIGTNTWGGWDWNDKWYGLQRMTETGAPFFDMLAVRSKGPTRIEVEFTEAVGAGMNQPGKYSVQQWGYTPSAGYGGGKTGNQVMTVKSATVSEDGKRVTLEMDGLKAKNVVHIKVNGATSASARPLWSNEAWYTLNAFGPGQDVQVTPTALGPEGRAAAAPFTARAEAGGRIAWRSPFQGRFRAEIRDAAGKLWEAREGHGPAQAEYAARETYPAGIYAVSVLGNGTRQTRWVAVPK